MKFRLIALASCVALGSIAFGGKAQAQDFFVQQETTLSSGGTFGPFCSFSTPPSPGVMRQSGPNTLTSDPTVSGASAATFGLTCSASASVIVRSSTIAAGATLVAAPTTVTATLRDVTTNIASSTLQTPSSPVNLTATAFTDKTYNLVHVVNNTTGLPSGTYGFDTVVAVTPR